MTLSPVLSAMMCDGMGWFADNDYKRILLAYDQIHYLLPQETAEFRDVSGAPIAMFFPPRLEPVREFVVHSFRPDERLREILMMLHRPMRRAAHEHGLYYIMRAIP
jgi:hypothetical protein